MKKIIFALCLLFPVNVFAEDLADSANSATRAIANKSANIKTSINLGGEVDESELNEKAKNFIKKLDTCEAYKETFGSKTEEIVGKHDNVCEVLKTKGGNSVKCLYPLEKLPIIVSHYKKELSDSFSGKYNLDLNMKMPEIDFSNLSSDLLNFNFKMEMPKIKIDKIKSDAEIIIEESCK